MYYKIVITKNDGLMRLMHQDRLGNSSVRGSIPNMLRPSLRYPLLLIEAPLCGPGSQGSHLVAEIIKQQCAGGYCCERYQAPVDGPSARVVLACTSAKELRHQVKDVECLQPVSIVTRSRSKDWSPKRFTYDLNNIGLVSPVLPLKGEAFVFVCLDTFQLSVIVSTFSKSSLADLQVLVEPWEAANCEFLDLQFSEFPCSSPCGAPDPGIYCLACSVSQKAVPGI